ncbi:hypothetical protein ACHAXR_008030 [Thalassiosira sp. AJA248-18]
MRQATTSVLRRGNFSLGALSIGSSRGSLNNLKSNNNGGVQRLLASSSKAPPPARPAPASLQPKDKGQEAIEKSERLHAELTEMIAATKARQIEELERPFGAGVLSFLKASKPEMVNIFFAFVCVLLAYQIHGMRAGIRKLLANQEEKDAEIDRLRNLLANLSEEETGSDEVDTNNGNSFSARLAQKCVGVVRQIFEESEKQVGYSWILGKKLAGGDALELEKLGLELQPIILSDIQSVVGDAAFTPEQLKERRVEALKVENDSAQPSHLEDGSQPSNGVGNIDAQMGGLMEILEEVHNQELTDEQNKATSGDEPTKVRRTRYAI